METDFYRGTLQTHGIESVVPELISREYIHQKIISELVLNEFTVDTKHGFLSAIEDLIDKDVQGVILGCTEIPLLLSASEHKGFPLFSTTEIHCREIVERTLN